MENKTILSGITATGKLTIGNYFGAIKNLVECQDKYNLYAFIANLHAITISIESKILSENIFEMLKIYKACGLDFKKSNIYLQSDIKAIGTLNWVLTCQTTIGELSRMTQYKDKSQNIKAGNNTNYIPTGILTYPILMASDILLFSPDIVSVGVDQKQHVELTRDLAIRFNNKYTTTFKIPKFETPKVGSKIFDLMDPTKKMSKSSGNQKSYIQILDSPSIIRKKISSAITDSENIVKYDPNLKPGVSNLITIYASAKDISIREAENLLRNKNYKEFKDAVSDSLINILTPIQERYKDIDLDDIKNDLENNAKKLNKLANNNLDIILKKTGINIF
ncbi:tryptophan--tRNA ligase [Spiroplasma endosymbiont of Aspidapion aeneum]|uniref:tryptophan--tRNA ligase n=1 Tax=Spiroplasma endosymbiont of Aspidapion aeneum TaxID=3066276 RepID=UPI00313D7CB2